MRTARVLAGAALLAAAVIAAARWSGDAAAPEKAALTSRWSVAVDGVQTVVATPLRPGALPGLLVQGGGEVLAVDAAGAVSARRRVAGTPLTAATGDVDGDGGEDLVIAHGRPMVVEALDGALRTLWSSAPIPGTAGRVLAVDLDGDGRREVVAGSAEGGLTALGSTGRPLWTWAFDTGTGEIRGLDDLRSGTDRLVVAARRSGEIVVLDGKGRVRKSLSAAGPLRRLRAFDADGDGRAEAHVGQEDGNYVTVTLDGPPLVLASLGDVVTDLRAVETDGNERTREVLVGGKRGTVVLIAGRAAAGRAEVGGKVSALAGVDTDGDGRDELFVGTEEGQLLLLDGQARVLARVAAAGKVERIVGITSPLRERLAVVAAGRALTAYRVERTAAPAWYRPHAALALALLAVAAGTVALVRALPPPAAPAPPPADPRTAELEAAAARVNDLVARGAVPAGAVAARLEQIRREIARATPPAAAISSPPPPPRR